MATTDETENKERAELEALRACVAALDAERAEEIARAHATVAAAQEPPVLGRPPAARPRALARIAGGLGAAVGRGALRQRTWPARLFLRRVRGWVRSALR